MTAEPEILTQGTPEIAHDIGMMFRHKQDAPLGICFPYTPSGWREVPEVPLGRTERVFEVVVTENGPDEVPIYHDGTMIAMARRGERRVWVCDDPLTPGVYAGGPVEY